MKPTIARPSAALILFLLPLLLGCEALGLDRGARQRDALVDNVLRWSLAGIESYEFTYDRWCFCEVIGAVVVEVHDGVVVSGRPREGSDPLPFEAVSRIPTVAEMFKVIERAIDQEADALEVTYHPTLGYPMQVAIDWDFGTADDESAFAVDDLRPISPPSADQ